MTTWHDLCEQKPRLCQGSDKTITCMPGEIFDKIRAVVDAASNDALLWNEELCDHEEYKQMEAAVMALGKALGNLGIDTTNEG